LAPTTNGGMCVKRILFVCVENAGRSQMAEAFANKYGEGKVIASSASKIAVCHDIAPKSEQKGR